jgi:ATP phosphoribosyltransferase
MEHSILIALPKGRLFESALGLLERAGIRPDGTVNGSRKLTFPDRTGKYAFVALKPVDIPVYVESGAVDVGLVGSDILREQDSDVFEPLDLRIGLCKLVLAGPSGCDISSAPTLHVATKYPRTAERHCATRNVHAHIVKLEGSVEIAPLLGLADVIVDLVETGRTLRENGLAIIEEIAPVSTKLIVNRTVMKTKAFEMQDLLTKLDRVVYENP